MEEIRNRDFQNSKLLQKEYEECIFQNCNFKGSNLSTKRFHDVIFKNCDFSAVDLKHAILSEVSFESCKLLGLNFSLLDSFLLSFRANNSDFSYSIFSGLKVRKETFKNSNFTKCLFEEVDFQECSFVQCNFLEATWEKCNLAHVDFISSENVVFDLESNYSKGAKFQLHQLPGLISKHLLKIDF